MSQYVPEFRLPLQPDSARMFYIDFVESEEPIAKSSNMINPCVTICIAIKNEIKQTRHQARTRGGNFPPTQTFNQNFSG